MHYGANGCVSMYKKIFNNKINLMVTELTLRKNSVFKHNLMLNEATKTYFEIFQLATLSIINYGALKYKDFFKRVP